MAEFVARIGTSGGEVVEKAFVSENADSLRRELDQKGFYVFSIQSRARGLAGLGMLARRERLPMRHFMVFNHELATLLKAGLPVLQGLDLLLERMENAAFRKVLADIRDQVKGGAAMSDAFSSHPQYFPPLYAASLRAGERSGELEGVIRRFIAYQRVIDAVRTKVTQALVYPALLLGFSAVVVWVLLTYAIPRFAEMYDTFGQELPLLTRMLIAVSGVFNRYWWATLGGTLLLVIGLRLWRESESGRLFIDRWKLKVPFAGTIWQKFAVSQLTRALSTLLRGGIPLVTALETAAGAVGNKVVSTRSRAAVQDIREGQSLSTALERTAILQPMVIEMVKVGESTGALAEMLGNVSDYYDEDIGHDLQRFLTLLEPLLLMFMGTVIATMLIAMYLPIFQLQSVAY